MQLIVECLTCEAESPGGTQE